MWREEKLCTLLVGKYIGAATIENSTKVLRSLRTELPYDPAILLLGIYPKKMKTLIQKDISTAMFIVALFTRAKIWI